MPTPYLYGAWRAHGTEISWRALQPTQGSYMGTGSDQDLMALNWTAFDQRVLQSVTQGVELNFHVWRTPSWASIPGDQVGGSNTVVGAWNDAGESAVPSNFQFVADITTAMLQRAISLGKPVRYLEPLNEPEMIDATALAAMIAGGGKPFWTGTAAQAVRYAWTVYQAAKAVDPNVIVLMPSQYLPSRMLQYLTAQDPVSGKFGHETFDWVNLHPYRAAPNKALGGEDLYYMSSNRIGIAQANRLMIEAGAQPKPIAATEWGLDTGITSLTAAFLALSTDERRKYIARLLAMAALNGYRQFYLFSNATLAGNFDTDTEGAIAAVTEVHTALAGQTIVDGGWDWDGTVKVTLATGQTFAW